MKLLTRNNRILYLFRLGESDAEGSEKLFCRDENGNKVVIAFRDVRMCFGSFTLPPMTYGHEKN